MTIHRLLLAFALLTAACSGGADGDDVTGDPDVLVGTFDVELVAPEDATPYTSVLGTVFDAPQPVAIIWEVAATEGDCTLVTPRVPFCSTPCGSAAVCVEDDVCQPYATRQEVGTVHVTGLETSTGATTFDMEPIVGNYQPPGSIQLAYPAFADGDPIRLDADGSDFTGAFTLESTGIAALAMSGPDLALERDLPLALTWTAGDDATTIEVKLDISHHGGTRGKIECVAADTGSLTLAAPLVTGLLDLGAAGYPTIIVRRAVVGSTVISAGRVDLRVGSDVELPVTVPGVQSCTEDNQCPDPQTCQEDLTCA
jgi:hypothetical protein